MINAVAAIDPGTQECGLGRCVAGVVDRVALARSKATPKPSTLAPFDLAAVLSTAREAVAVLLTWGAFDLVVIEWPEVYADSSQKAENPNDLIPLAMMHGLVLTELRRTSPGTRVLAVRPKLWTKGTPKKPRQDQWRARPFNASAVKLCDAVMPASLRHNAVDAAHLSQWGYEYAAARSDAVLDSLTVRL